MPITALDVGDPIAAPPVLPPAPVLERPPATVVAVAALGLLEAVGIVAAALAGVGSGLTAARHPDGVLAGVVLVSLAAWVVACAAGGAGVLDATGRRLLTSVAATELVALAGLLLVGLAVPLPAVLTGGLPVPVAVLLTVPVPAGKLLLGGAGPTERWLAQGPRPRERRVDPVAAHRGLCIGTLVVLGVVLGAVALLGPAAPAPHGPGPSSTASTQP